MIEQASFNCSGCGTHISIMTTDPKAKDLDMGALTNMGFLVVGDSIYCRKCKKKIPEVEE